MQIMFTLSRFQMNELCRAAYNENEVTITISPNPNHEYLCINVKLLILLTGLMGHTCIQNH